MRRFLRTLVFASVPAAALLLAAPSVAQAHTVRIIDRHGVVVERERGPVVYYRNGVARYRYFEPGFGYHYYYYDPPSRVYIEEPGFIEVRPRIRGGGVDVGPLHIEG